MLSARHLRNRSIEQIRIKWLQNQSPTHSIWINHPVAVVLSDPDALSLGLIEELPSKSDQQEVISVLKMLSFSGLQISFATENNFELAVTIFEMFMAPNKQEQLTIERLRESYQPPPSPPSDSPDSNDFF